MSKSSATLTAVMNMTRYKLGRFVLICMAGLFVAIGCERQTFVAGMATRPYPRDLHTTNVVDIQVFRDDSDIEIVNSTAQDFRNIDVWINQRYVQRIEALPAGKRLTLSLWDFFDERGERMNAGGFFRTTEPTPVRLVEIQVTPESPMIGLITIPEVEIIRGE